MNEGAGTDVVEKLNDILLGCYEHTDLSIDCHVTLVKKLRCCH